MPAPGRLPGGGGRLPGGGPGPLWEPSWAPFGGLQGLNGVSFSGLIFQALCNANFEPLLGSNRAPMERFIGLPKGSEGAQSATSPDSKKLQKNLSFFTLFGFGGHPKSQRDRHFSELTFINDLEERKIVIWDRLELQLGPPKGPQIGPKRAQNRAQFQPGFRTPFKTQLGPKMDPPGAGQNGV